MFKRLLKIAGLVLACLATLLGAFLLYVGLDGIPRYKVHPPVLTVEQTPERIARGKKLSALMCAGCHENTATGRLTGKRSGRSARCLWRGLFRQHHPASSQRHRQLD